MLFIRQLTIVYAMMVVVVQTSLHGADDTITFIIIHPDCTAGARWIFITYHKQIYILSKQMNYLQVYKVVMETKIVVRDKCPTLWLQVVWISIQQSFESPRVSVSEWNPCEPHIGVSNLGYSGVCAYLATRILAPRVQLCLFNY